MRRRGRTLIAADRPNYVTVPLDGRDPIMLRLPDLGTASLLAEICLSRTQPVEGEDRTGRLGRATVVLHAAAAAVGACWWHPTVALDTAWHDHAPDGTAGVLRYGSLVAEELAEGLWDRPADLAAWRAADAEARSVPDDAPPSDARDRAAALLTRAAFAPLSDADLATVYRAVLAPLCALVVSPREVRERALFS